MLFVFRTLNFFALGAILLTPFWMFNSRLDRLLPHAPPIMSSQTPSPHNDAMRDRFVIGLNNLKRDIRADMCRRDDAPLCLLTICLPIGKAGPRPSRCR